jgi:hypothetical protein
MLELPAPLQREWLWSALEALIERRGEDTFLKAPLVIPDDTFFPDRFTPDADGIAGLARRLLGYAGLSHLDVSVETYEEEVDIHEVGYDGKASKWSHAGTAAWFAGIEGGTRAIFGANTAKLDDPLGLVATMAHECAHTFRHAHKLQHRDRDHEEKLTDVTTVYLGFGLLTTATTMRYAARQVGNTGVAWQHSQQGYLSPGEMSLLLATQLVMRGYPPAAVRAYAKHLPANQRSLVDRAMREIDRVRISDVLGFEAVPPPQQAPVKLSLWSRLFG